MNLKKLKTRMLRFFAAVTVFVLAAGSLSGCAKESYEDYYTFDTSMIKREYLIGTPVKLDPVVKNLGKEIADAGLGITVMREGSDVTDSLFNHESKLLTPDKTGSYDIAFQALNADGSPAADASGKPFAKKIVVDIVAMGFVPKDKAGTDIIVNQENEERPLITFGQTYNTTSTISSNQYRVTGVDFHDSYRITYSLSNLKFNIAAPQNVLYFGIDRADGGDDHISLNLKDGTLGGWFWKVGNNAAGGNGWSIKENWLTSVASVSNHGPVEGSHTISFSRYLNKEKTQAYYGIDFDGKNFAVLDLKDNFNDILPGIWVEALSASATVGIYQFSQLDTDTQAPAVQASFDGDYLAGNTYSLKDAATVTDNGGYDALLPVTFSARDPLGKPVTVRDEGIKPTLSGIYKITVTAKDLTGNAASVTADFPVGANFSVAEVAVNYKKGTEGKITPRFYGVDTDTLQTVTAEIFRLDGTQSGNIVTGAAPNGLKFTPTESGVFQLKISVKIAGGTLVKEKRIAVTEPGTVGAVVDMTKTTGVTKTNLSTILYYSVTDSVEGDCTKSADVKILKGSILESAADVTDTMLSTVKSKTTAAGSHIEYSVFLPSTAGNYWLSVTYINAGHYITEGFKPIVVTDVLKSVYGTVFEGGKHSDRIIYGKDELVYKGFTEGGVVDGSKMIYEGLRYAKNWSLSFDATDLRFSPTGLNNGKLVFSMFIKGNDGHAGAGWEDIAIGGKEQTDFWGFETSTIGTGWTTYQWRATWQEPVTNEFDPEEGGGFRESGEYARYMSGTHTYKLVCTTDKTTGAVKYNFYIDGRNEATHRLPAAHNNISTLDCLVVSTQSTNCFVTNIRMTQL